MELERPVGRLKKNFEESESKFMCNFCEKYVSCSRSLREHQLNCSFNPDREENIQCGECLKILKSKRALSKHINAAKKTHLSLKESRKLSFSAHKFCLKTDLHSGPVSLENMFTFSQRQNCTINICRSSDESQVFEDGIYLVNVSGPTCDIDGSMFENKVRNLTGAAKPIQTSLHFPLAVACRYLPIEVFMKSGHSAVEIESLLRALFGIMNTEGEKCVSSAERSLGRALTSLRNNAVNPNTIISLFKGLRFYYENSGNKIKKNSLIMGFRKSYEIIFCPEDTKANLKTEVNMIMKVHQRLEIIFCPIKIYHQSDVKYVLAKIVFSSRFQRKNFCQLTDFNNISKSNHFLALKDNIQKQIKYFGNMFPQSTQRGWRFHWDLAAGRWAHTGLELIFTILSQHFKDLNIESNFCNYALNFITNSSEPCRKTFSKLFSDHILCCVELNSDCYLRNALFWPDSLNNSIECCNKC